MYLLWSSLVVWSVAAAEPTVEPVFYLERSDSGGALTPSENAAMAVALTGAARGLGKTMQDAVTVQKVLDAVENGVAADGTVCGAPVRWRNRQDEAVRRLGPCAADAPCNVRRATWTALCSVQWEACSVSMTFPSEGKDNPPQRWGILFPQREAATWKSVDELAQAIAAAPKERWKRLDERPESAISGLLGGLGMSSSGTPQPALREREPALARVELGTFRKVTTPDVVWNLLRSRDGEHESGVTVEPALGACLAKDARDRDVDVWLRRDGKGALKATVGAPPDVAACVEKGLAARIKALKDVTALRWTLVRHDGDVVTANKKYVVDVRVEQAMRPGAPFPMEAKVSDPGLDGWKSPDHTAVARCFADFPFTDAYAATEKRSTVRTAFTVTFDAKGAATGVAFSPVKEKDTPVPEATLACLNKAALSARAPCTASGGTAGGTITASAYVVAAAKKKE